MFCPKCGAEAAGAFCTRCGAKLPELPTQTAAQPPSPQQVPPPLPAAAPAQKSWKETNRRAARNVWIFLGVIFLFVFPVLIGGLIRFFSGGEGEDTVASPGASASAAISATAEPSSTPSHRPSPAPSANVTEAETPTEQPEDSSMLTEEEYLVQLRSAMDEVEAYEGISIPSISLVDRVLTVTVDIRPAYPTYSFSSLASIVDGFVNTVTYPILDLDRQYWDTVIVDFGEFGTCTNTTDNIRNDGGGGYFTNTHVVRNSPVPSERTELYEDFFAPNASRIGWLTEISFSSNDNLATYQVEYQPGSETDICSYRIYSQNNEDNYVFLVFYPRNVEDPSSEWVWTLTALIYVDGPKEISISDSFHLSGAGISYSARDLDGTRTVNSLDEIKAFLFE